MFWHFTLFRCKFDSPQVKCYLMPRLMNLVHHLAHELPNDLRLRILGRKKTLWPLFMDGVQLPQGYLVKK